MHKIRVVMLIPAVTSATSVYDTPIRDDIQVRQRHCFVQVDLSTASSQTRFGKTGQMYYILDPEAILPVGLAEPAVSDELDRFRDRRFSRGYFPVPNLNLLFSSGAAVA